MKTNLYKILTIMLYFLNKFNYYALKYLLKILKIIAIFIEY